MNKGALARSIPKIISTGQLLRFPLLFHSVVTDPLQSYALFPEGECEVNGFKQVLGFLCLFCFAILNIAARALAQEPTGAIAGTVQDNTAAVVAGATVTLQIPGGQPLTAAADEKGEYVFTGLKPGTYTVSLALQGFQTFEAKSVVVTAGQTSKVDITLVPATVNEQVNVQGQSVSQIEAESSQISGTITGKEITSLMLNGRNFTQLIALTPGVSNQTGQDEALVGVKGSVKYSVNGGRVEYNSYEVDGADILNASINGSNSTLLVYPSLDALGSLQVLTSNYGAQYGRSASGITVASVKSGSSEFHGDGYLFVRNEIFNARNFFDQTRRAPLYRKYDAGFTLGGPLYIPGIFNTKKDKTFFFLSEEWRHEREPTPYNQAVPSLAERTGDFNDICPVATTPHAQIDDASGGWLFTRSLAVSQQFQIPYFPDCPGEPTPQIRNVPPNAFRIYHTFDLNNQVPTFAISPQSQAIVNSGLIPLPNSAFGCTSTIAASDPVTGAPNPHCYATTLSPLTTWRQDLFRIDHNFTANQKIYFRYIHDSWETQVLSPQWSPVSNSVPTVENDFVGPGLSLAAHLTSTFGTKFVNDLAMTYGHDHISLTNVAGPGVTSLNRSDYPALAAAPCDLPNSSQCAFGGIGYLFGTPALDTRGVAFGNKIPAIVLSGPNFAYGGQPLNIDTGYMPWRHSNPTYQPRDDATLALGKHTLQFGVLAILAQRSEVNQAVGANTGNVQGTIFLTTASQNSTGNVFSDLLLFGSNQSGGAPHPPATYTQDSAQGTYHQSYNIVEPYVQDDFKVTRWLTVNLGVRFSLFGLYSEKNHLSYNWVPSQFDSALQSQLSYFPRTGALVIGPSSPLGSNNFLPIDINNLSPYLTNGLVRCGVDKYKDGTPVPAGCMDGHLFNPAPRIGFAWDPQGHGKMSIRAGYGIFFEHGTGNEANTGSLEGSPGNANAGGVISATQYGVPSWACIGNVGEGCTTLTSGGSAFPISLTAIPTKATWPYTQQWNFSLQRELPKQMLASVAYVGSKGTHLTAQLNANQLVPVNQAQNPFLPGQPLDSAFCTVIAQAANGTPSTWNGNPVGPQFVGWSNALAGCYGGPGSPSDIALPNILPGTLRTPGNVIAPFFGQIYLLQNVANSNYNAMQFSLRRSTTNLTLGVSYTWSHSIDDSSDRTQATFINAYNLPSNRASSDFDQRHLLNFSYVYQLPLRRLFNFLTFADEDPTNTITGGKRGAPNPTLWDGWELSGITTFQTGTPFSALNAGSLDGISTPDNAGVVTINGPASYADLATNPASSPGRRAGGGQTFGPLLGNPNLFIAPTGFTFGNSGRNYLHNPSRTNFDMALAKNFSIAEGKSLQFRMETFNIFNHTQFRIYNPSRPGNPGNNVISCYGDTSFSAGDPGCLTTTSFLHPIDAHRPRTVQLGVKLLF